MTNNIITKYLKYLLENKMDEIIKDKDIVIYNTIQDINLGLIIFDTPPKNKIFIFKLPKEEIVDFTTIGMKFPIKILFFNSKKEMVYSPGIAKPGIDKINSKYPCKYVIEIPVGG